MVEHPDIRGLHDELITHSPLPDPLEPFRVDFTYTMSDECRAALAAIDRNIARSHANAHKLWVD